MVVVIVVRIYLVIMATDRITAFFNLKTVHTLYMLSKDELRYVADKLEIMLSANKKEEMQIELKHVLMERDWFKEDSEDDREGEREVEEPGGENVGMFAELGDMVGLSSSEKFELMKLHLQMKMRNKMEVEMEKIKADKEIKIKQAEIGSGARGIGNTDKKVKYVPEFVEGEEEDFFLQFEKTAKLREWDESEWALLVQSKFKGKAREAYVSLSDQEAGNYEMIQEAVLKSTRLSPGVYRERFRNVKKRPGSTYLEMARECCLKLDRWMKAEGVKTVDEMREVFLMEHFLDQTPPNLKYELISHSVKDVMEAGRKADSYVEAHGLSKSEFQGGKRPFFNKGGGNYGSRNNHQGTSRPFNKFNQPKLNNYSMSQNYNQQPQNKYNLRPTPSKVGQGNTPYYYNKINSGNDTSVKCIGCGEVGHKKYQCQKGKSKPVGAVAAVRNSGEFVEDEDPILPFESQEDEDFEHFIVEGMVKLEEGPEKKIRILRDTGANQSLILKSALPWTKETDTGRMVSCRGAGGKFCIPLHKVWLDCGYITGEVTIGVKETLPVDGVDMLMGNDLGKKRVIPNLQMVENPLKEMTEATTTQAAVHHSTRGEAEVPEVFPVCAVTRAMARRGIVDAGEAEQEDRGPDSTFVGVEEKGNRQENENNKMVECQVETNIDFVVEKNELVKAQEGDESLKPIWNEAKRLGDLDDEYVGYYVDRGILMRSWRPLETPASAHWMMKRQIVVPQVYRRKLLEMAHEGNLAGHLGVRKTLGKILCHYYWPKVKNDVSEFCKTCVVCQRVGKPNQVIRPAPLCPIPVVEEPFSKIVIDCVGPLPRTRKGNQYLLTIMCVSSRFPEAIPLRNIHSKTIVRELVKFFSWVGIPKIIQSDQGSNFTSRVFKEILKGLKIEHKLSSAYHPQSQGCVERFHQTLKSTLRMYCEEMSVQWDEALPLALFALRDSIQESTGFSPFELVFGHEVNGPMRMVKEKWLGKEDPPNVVKYVSDFKDRLMRAREIAHENLKSSQGDMKGWYDRKARTRSFQPGDKVLVLFPLQGDPFKARFSGPWEIERKLSDVNYIVKTPGRRKKNQLCHINMLKQFHERKLEGKDEQGMKKVCIVNAATSTTCMEEEWAEAKLSKCEGMVLENSAVLGNLNQKLGHMELEKKEKVIEIIQKYIGLFPDAPRKTNLVVHDVDVGNAKPVKQHPYRVNPQKREIMRKEVEYMLENELIEPSESPWSSPCVLVPKPGQDNFRFCTDYRKVNMVTKPDAYPIPRIDDCIDHVGNANFITKIDLLKGYWQVGLTKRAKEISAFVTMDGLYQYKVLPFGMKNSGSSFQRLMNRVLKGLKGCSVYIDDILLYTEEWEEHVQLLEDVFKRLDDANLTINLMKSHFVQADVEYLGFKVGRGKVRTVEAKVKDIVDLPLPTNRKEILRFLGASGYYRRFCKNFSDVAMPLTNLLAKKSKFCWNEKCNEAFNEIKKMLVNAPVLRMPDYEKPFVLYVDASQNGVGSVLMQEHEGVDHPIGYYSKKLLPYQRAYSTIEKEALGLVLSLNHFEVYVKGTGLPVQIFTDHNPLVFLHRMKNSNQRLMRWCLVLQDYDLDIHHVKGSENVIADALSRAPCRREAS